MAANNTPLYDLIELSSFNPNATFTTTPGGGGDIIGMVDNATYSDNDGSNSSTEIEELNETADSDNGTLTIDGVVYNIQLYVPDGSGEDVTVTYNNGASSTDLSGSGYSSDVVLIQASPMGGGSDRYFVAIDDGVGDLPDITTIQFQDIDWNPSGDDVKINLDQDNNVAPVCYAKGTRIATPHGDRLVEDLRVGDQVSVPFVGPQEIRWIGHRKMSFDEAQQTHKPIQIKAGALGRGLPHWDLAVSPQHRILFKGAMVQALFGEDRVLAVAKGLIGHPGIRVMNGKRRVTYFALLLDHHHILTANGAASESFFPGPIALRLLSEAQRREVTDLFPELKSDPKTGYGETAHRVLTLRETQQLVATLKQPGPVLSRFNISAGGADPLRGKSLSH